MLVRAVESVLTQSYRPIEVIIVNDGSTDNTASVADALAVKHPDIIGVLHIDNSGPGKAREAARVIAKGDFIQYLDSDDWLMPNKFSDQINALEITPDADIVYGVTRLVDVDGKVLKEPSKDTGTKRRSLFPALLVDRWWHTSTPIYSKRISDLAGEWPDKRPEDWDLEARMGAHRPVLAYADTVVSCHLEHDSPGRISHGKHKEYMVDEAWFLPRLFESALKAGVKRDAGEMAHFSKWAFMRSRHLGAIGETQLAKKLFSLSLDAALRPSMQQSIVKVVAPIIGWKLIGMLGEMVEKIR
jgi:glycosyltransferase involved in cell wall biosynthesis